MLSSLSTFPSPSCSPTCIFPTVVLSTSGMANENFFLLIALSECDQRFNEMFNVSIHLLRHVNLLCVSFFILDLKILPTHNGIISAIKFAKRGHGSGIC